MPHPRPTGLRGRRVRSDRPARRTACFRLAIGATFLTAGVLVAACSSSSTTSTTSSSAPSSSAASTGASSGTSGGSTTIVIRTFEFMPVTLTVSPGATVKVFNEDQVAHTLTASKGQFDTGDIPAGQSKTFTAPSTKGTYAYICTIHPFMHGTLIVS